MQDQTTKKILLSHQVMQLHKVLDAQEELKKILQNILPQLLFPRVKW